MRGAHLVPGWSAMPIRKTCLCSRTIAFLSGLTLSGLLLGCASNGRAEESSSRPIGSPTSRALVFATPDQWAVLALEATETPSESWAFSRHDRALAVRDQAPLLATNQWPEVLPPLERPVWFHRWVQH